MKPKSIASFASRYPVTDETSRNHEKRKSQNKPPRCCTNIADVPSSVSGPMAGNCEEENRNNHMLALVPDDASPTIPSLPVPATSEFSIQNPVSSEPVSNFSVSPEAVHDVPRTSDTVCATSVPVDPGFTEPNAKATPTFKSACHYPGPPKQVLALPNLTGLGAPVSSESAQCVPVPAAPILTEQFRGAPVLSSALGPSTRNAVANHNISVTNNCYSETSSLLPPLSTQEWKISYKKCDKIAKHLDLIDGWKLLASKLQFEIAINWVDQWAKNMNKSPTVLLLEKWMEQSTENNEACFNCLLEALRSMCRKDIADELEDLDD